MPLFGEPRPSGQPESEIVVFKKGTRVIALDAEGREIDKGTAGTGITAPQDDITVMQSALDGLLAGRDYQQKVTLRGNFFTSAPIVVSAFTYLKLLGKVTLANNINDNLLENAHPLDSDTGVTLEGGIWDGNMANNPVAGGGIYWFHTNYPADYQSVIMRKMDFLNIRGDCLHFQALVQLCLHHIRQWNIGNHGLICHDVSDSYIHHLLPVQGASADAPMQLLSMGSVDISNIYCNNGVYIYASPNLSCDEWNVDMKTDRHGIDMRAVRHGVFSNFRIRIQGDGGANNKDAIRLRSSDGVKCVKNSFTNIYAGRRAGVGTNRWNYGINETDADMDKNLYVNINAEDAITAALRLQGVNSQWTNVLGAVVGN